MTLWSWVRGHLGGGSAGPRPTRSGTASGGVTEVRSGRPQDTGGRPGNDAVDQHSTTGTTPSETFVGRVAGDDAGYLETGAEKRAAADGRAGTADDGESGEGRGTSR
jgi:hypothetical protein